MTLRVEEFLSENATTRGSSPAMSDETGCHLTWQGVSEAVVALADVLTAQGATPGDRVLILCENCVAAVAALFATWHVGATAVPLNARQSKAEVDRVLAHATPRVVLATVEVSKEASAHAQHLSATDLVGAFGRLQMAIPYHSNPEAGDVPAVMLYTTGTTGDPKGVMLSHSNLIFGGKTSAALRHMTERDVIYGLLPISHIFGLSSIVVAAAFTGAYIRFAARFSEKALYEALQDGITLLSAVPQMHAHLMQYAKEQGVAALGSPDLRYVSSGAAPLDPTWKREAEAFYGLCLQNGYGMTETTAGVCITDNPIGSDDVSVGPPLPEVEVKIAATQGETDTDVGEILTRGPHVMMGYYKNPSETAKVLDQDGWMHTGDLGRLDDQGRLHILGRSKELIIRGGFNVYPPEVEAAINDHPDVVQSAVLGRQIVGNEEVVAFVQISESATLNAEDLSLFLQSKLAGYKRPQRIILARKLPAAPTGKVLRHKLMAHFASELDDG